MKQATEEEIKLKQKYIMFETEQQKTLIKMSYEGVPHCPGKWTAVCHMFRIRSPTENPFNMSLGC